MISWTYSIFKTHWLHGWLTIQRQVGSNCFGRDGFDLDTYIYVDFLGFPTSKDILRTKVYKVQGTSVQRPQAHKVLKLLLWSRWFWFRYIYIRRYRGISSFSIHTANNQKRYKGKRQKKLLFFCGFPRGGRICHQVDFSGVLQYVKEVLSIFMLWFTILKKFIKSGKLL